MSAGRVVHASRRARRSASPPPTAPARASLLRLIASLDRPTAGRIAIHGYDTVRRARAVRDRIGYVPEEPMLYDGLSAEQYLQFVGRARGLGKQVRQVAVDTLLQVVGLEERRWRDVSAFSPGERRRLALASALVHEPDVLLLDDPLRGLDGFARLEQIEVLRELHRLGSTMVVSRHAARGSARGVRHVRRPARRHAGVERRRGQRRPRWPRRSTRTPSAYAPSCSKASRPALALLGQRRDLRELEVDEDGRTVWFLFSGDQEALANLLPQLIRAGCSVAHFGIERRSPPALPDCSTKTAPRYHGYVPRGARRGTISYGAFGAGRRD